MSSSERSATFLVDMIIHLETKLTELGLEPEKAMKVSQDTVDELRQTYGGEQFYFPRGWSLDVTLSHHKIYAKFRGHNHVQLSKEFNVSVTHIYRVVKAIQDAEAARRQPGLF
ncbi:Mor transcription activator family protein [Shewanella woodyi]|uniref:Mor transcription activator family protein n=1 Tax=Shewanella woodyi TaxID=60961 RepID=UPI0007F96208|nr:Mor transcription activator family protein [Shewanella woodyi]